MKKLEIIQADVKDLPRILEIYAYAREFMKKTGNPTQWKDNRPEKAVLEMDIENENLYVLRDEDKIYGVFALIIGHEPTYARIENGRWLSDKPYGTIHRIASDGKIQGCFAKIVEFCSQKIEHLRIDTHEDNKIMQHLMVKQNFEKCGRIYVADGSPRIAYERMR